MEPPKPRPVKDMTDAELALELETWLSLPLPEHRAQGISAKRAKRVKDPTDPKPERKPSRRSAWAQLMGE